jgi:hypothetical protein
MTIETGEKQETPQQEQAEGGQKHPVKSIDEALAMIKALASAAAGGGDPADAGQADDGSDTGADAASDGQEQAMMGSYRAGVRG